MTDNEPPRLAMSLLGRCLPEDDPLTGDLVEEFDAGRGRVWFWRQTLAAVSRRGPRSLRLGTVLALAVLIGPLVAYVAYARSVPQEAELPALVEQLTIEDMIRSVRTGDVYGALRFDGDVVDVTGVLERVISKPEPPARGVLSVYVTSAAHVPAVGAVFSLDPSVDIAVLTLGETVTLRCPVRDQRVRRTSCLVVPIPESWSEGRPGTASGLCGPTRHAALWRHVVIPTRRVT